MQGNRNPFIDNPYLATVIWNGPQAEDTWGLLSVQNMQAVSFNVYPTLTTGKIYIESTTANRYTYTVHNSLGQQVKFSKSEDSADLTGNTPGIYFVNVQSNNANTTIKVILK